MSYKLSQHISLGTKLALRPNLLLLFLPMLFFIGIGIGFAVLGKPEFYVEKGLEGLILQLKPTIRWVTVAGFLLILLYPLPLSEGKRLATASHSLLLRLSIACWVVGYANSIFGVIPSIIGILAPYIVGTILYMIRAILMRRNPSFTPRGYWIAAVLFLIYDGVTLLWSPNLELSYAWWCRELSLFPPLALFLVYPLSATELRFLMHYLSRIVILFTLGILVGYLTSCLVAGFPIHIAFTFNKTYLAQFGSAFYSSLFASFYGFDHYTYLVLLLLAPTIYWLLEAQVKPYRSFGFPMLGFLGVLCYAFIVQSRFGEVVCTSFLALYVLYLFFRGNYRTIIPITLLGVMLSAFFLWYFDVPLLHHLLDHTRLSMLEAATQYLGYNFWGGYGLGTSHCLLFGIGMPDGADVHFHNQWIQCLIEGGIMSLLLWGAIWICYLFAALQRRNNAAITMVMLMLLMMCIDLFTCFNNYFLSIGIMAALLLSTTSRIEKEKNL